MHYGTAYEFVCLSINVFCVLFRFSLGFKTLFKSDRSAEIRSSKMDLKSERQLCAFMVAECKYSIVPQVTLDRSVDLSKRIDPWIYPIDPWIWIDPDLSFGSIIRTPGRASLQLKATKSQRNSGFSPYGATSSAMKRCGLMKHSSEAHPGESRILGNIMKCYKKRFVFLKSESSTGSDKIPEK